MAILFKWRNAITSKFGPTPVTRHILLTLSLHMNQAGGSCFPSIKKLVEETGLAKRTIIRHLNNAEKKGWIRKMVCGFSGQGWKRHAYEPAIPEKVLELIQCQSGVTESPRLQKGGDSQSKGGDSQYQKVVSQSHSSIPYNSSDNSSNKYSQNSIEFRLSKILLDLILKRNPKFKKPNLQNWAMHIDKAIRLDKRTPEELRKVIEWCQADTFWQNNILSTQKLRKQFDRLYMQSKPKDQVERLKQIGDSWLNENEKKNS